MPGIKLLAKWNETKNIIFNIKKLQQFQVT